MTNGANIFRRASSADLPVNEEAAAIPSRRSLMQRKDRTSRYSASLAPTPVEDTEPETLRSVLREPRTAHLSTIPVVPIKPLVAVHLVEGSQGGVGTAVRNLIEHQRNDPTVGDIHLFADQARLGEMLQDVSAVIHPYQSSRSAMGIVRAARELFERISALRPDVVYLHSTFPGIYGRLFKGRQTHNWTTIYCAHGWAFAQEVAFPRRVAYAMLERLLARRADAIISISHNEFRTARKYGVRHSNHAIVLHGTSAPREEPSVAQLTKGDHINVLFVGRFDRQKGVDVLLSAWKDSRLSNFHLWLIGAPTLGCAVDIPSVANVHSLGWVKYQDIDSYIRSADVVVIPSRWEGFGLVALEAMRNGKPIVANRVGGLQELLIEGVNGHFFNLKEADSLISVLAGLTKERIAAMGSVAKVIFNTGFDGKASYQQWMRITSNAINARRPTEPVTENIPHRQSLVAWSFAKRSLDVVGSSLGILLLLPLLLTLAILIKLTSRGPALFGHYRVGKNGRTFRTWKFRTMVRDSDRILQQHLQSDPDLMAEWNACHKLRNDPRVTPLGRILRRFSLDELPQLLNVLTGDMSLVGPRPIVRSEITRYAAAYESYCRVRPGLTGLWQVSGRNNTTYAERIAFDQFYVSNWSLWLDFSILFRTFRVVLLAEGAY